MKHFYFNSKGFLLNLFMGFLSFISVSDMRAAKTAEKIEDDVVAVEAKLGKGDVSTKKVTNEERVKLVLNILNKVLSIIEYAPNINFPGIGEGIRGFLGGGKYSETILKSDLIKVLELIKDIFADKESVFISLARIIPSKKVHAVAHRVQDMGKNLNTLIDTLMVTQKLAAISKKDVGEKPVEVPKAPEVITVTDDELDFS